MSRYYFDFLHGSDLLRDEEGIELSSLSRVQAEAACSLAEMARDVICGQPEQLHDFAIQVRADNEPFLIVRFTFEWVGMRDLH